MSKRRQDWKESLKQDAAGRGKRKKINILKDEIYNNVEGKMILVSSQSNNTRNNSIQGYHNDVAEITENKGNTNTINSTTKQDCTSTLELETNISLKAAHNEENFEIMNNNIVQDRANTQQLEIDVLEITPYQSSPKLGIDNLTPTFRKPDFFLAKTKEVMKSITPVKLFPIPSEMHMKEAYTMIPPYGTEQNEENVRNFSNLNNMESILREQNYEANCFEGTFSAEYDVNNNPEHSLEIIVKPEIHNEPRKEKNVQGDDNKHENIIIRNYVIEDEIISLAEDKTVTETSDPAFKTTRNPKVNRSRRNIYYDKSYLDYMSDEDLDQHLIDEAFPSEASSEEYDTEESSDLSNDENKFKKNKKKKKQSKKKTKKDIKKKKEVHNVSAEKKPTKHSIRQETKKRKEMGQSYTNDKGELVEGKAMKPNSCVGKKCGNDCGNIAEERRQNLFLYFWNLNSNQRRKDWIAQCAVKKSIKRPKKDANTRSCAYDYFINEGEGRRKVCQKYLINTLDVIQRFILYTLENTDDGYSKTDGRVSNGGSNKTNEEVTEHAKKFIESLPKMPSHYCRKDSRRLYFPEEFRNMCNLHRIYKNNCMQSGIKGMTFQVFRTWFKKSYNIGFHVPKKDKCPICINTKNIEEKSEEEKEKIERHIKEKDESYKRFKYHQTIHGMDKKTICASFDMQKVLNTPLGESMMLYYSRKFAVYNFTIYESTTRRGYCNVWTETDAHRGANEICTCLYNYIKKLDSCGSANTLLLYCDSCYGQNKNKYVLSMIRYALSQCKNIKTIQINYLIPGHTYMPVDSIHATIETKIRKCTIWAPSQWATIMEVARQAPEPYKVEVLKGKDFFGFEDIVNATFKKNLKLLISKLNIATFKKQEPNVMYIKKSMLPNAEAIKINLLPMKNMTSLKEKLYPTELGISAKKYKDLKSLVDRNIIPSRFAAEYINLKVSNKIKDALVDLDEEDVEKIENDDLKVE